MAKLNVIDLSGAAAGELDVADEVFATEVNEHLLWEVVRSQRAAKRQGTAHTKTRAEVAITKAKIYRQKGTGNARHGSRRANVFKGGGVTHGPRNTVNHTIRVNRKAIAVALKSALSLRAASGNLVVIKEFKGESKASTKALHTALGKLEAPKALLVDDAGNEWLQLSARNLADADFLADAGLNVYDILNHPKLLISETSLRKIEARLTGKAADAAAQ
ncbi:MAG: 50S ribosomal protein L4 [Nannocystaceae bacterium]|nr:50S ribosomal protein L4 [bacterium]